jgi:hypothetical protein
VDARITSLRVCLFALAVEVIIARKRFDNEQKVERIVCGMMLRMIISGFEQYSIKKIDFCMRRVGIEYVYVLAQTVASTLSVLCLDFIDLTEEEDDDSACFC